VASVSLQATKEEVVKLLAHGLFIECGDIPEKLQQHIDDNIIKIKTDPPTAEEKDILKNIARKVKAMRTESESYASAKLAEILLFQARGRWTRSENQVLA
jgi:hypothetical protein